jgi:hypothetical protein
MSLLQLLRKPANRNLLDVVTKLPELGVGSKVTRASWELYGDSYWEITQVKPRKPDGQAGKVGHRAGLVGCVTAVRAGLITNGSGPSAACRLQQQYSMRWKQQRVCLSNSVACPGFSTQRMCCRCRHCYSSRILAPVNTSMTCHRPPFE